MRNNGERESEPLRELRARIEVESKDGFQLLENLEQNPICSVSLDEEIPAIVVIWKRYATSGQLRFIHESILELLKKHRLERILGDDTALPTIHHEDQSWIVEDWMPRAISAGLKAAASKSPSSYWGKISVDAIQAIAPHGLVLRSFSDLTAAREWLSGYGAATTQSPA